MTQTNAAKTRDEGIDYAETLSCRVSRLNAHPENSDDPIVVNVVANKNKGGGRRVIIPGQVVELTRAQVESLRNSVEETDFPLSEDSGIHESKDPIKTAKALYPGLTPVLNRETGEIRMVRSRRNFSVELV